jgi:fumarate reductase subunit D
MKTIQSPWWISVVVTLFGTREANAATLPSPLFAQVAGFLWGVLKIWGGAHMMSKGDSDGKMGIVAGIIIAGAASIMAALFGIFGMQAGALTPQF